MHLLVSHKYVTKLHSIRTKIACFTVLKGLPIHVLYMVRESVYKMQHSNRG
jgi:hypothetical protein